jgi:aminomethyltransferase
VAERLARLILAEPEVRPAGLGARDSLRLEAGLCLYGHDIDATTTPVEANLTWTIGPARRPGGARVGGYPGSHVIARDLAGGASRKRVGLRPEGRQPVRERTAVFERGGRQVGVVTSGGFSPTLETPIAMGYVNPQALGSGPDLYATVRGAEIAIAPAKLPFVAHRYRKA